VICAHISINYSYRYSLTVSMGLGLLLCVFFRFILELYVFVVLGLVSSVLSQEIGLEERLQNELFCVE